ncbi:MAG: 16S rRNA (guanine(527)-N(7))-methyltransferase RsmG [Erysipelotrichaceae bacterium]|nr:16S rRNA (guanine(527)-N(7))-methyltransferase RsmG [Erysipelotrichaceae bacterium]
MTYEELIQSCASFGLNLDARVIDGLKRYCALLQEWNEKMNLTSIVDEPEVIEKHFYDSLLVAKTFRFGQRKIADVGSGAGFPGAVIALAFPEAKVTLIDATKKKFAFLETLKAELHLDNLSFLVGRVEDIKAERESFDAVISRGFASLRVFAEVGAPLLYVTGTLIAMKGKNAEEELSEAKNILSKLHLRLKGKQEDKLPCGDARVCYFFAKDEHTPKRFPRRWDEIQRIKI